MTRAQIVALTEGSATLRSLSAGDLPLTLAWRNHPASRRWFHSSNEIALADHIAWFERYLERDDDTVFVLTIDGVPAAQVSLYDIADGSAEFGRLLVDPDARGRGAGRLACRLCLRVADEVLRLDDLRLEVKADNASAIRIYLELGFVASDDGESHEGSILMRRRRNTSGGAPPTE